MTFKFYGMTPQDAVTCILGGAFRYNNGQNAAVVQGLQWAEQLAELLRMQSAWDAVGNKVSIKIADSNPAGTPGAKVDVSRLSPDPTPPHDSQEEAQRAAGIWPQEAEPATVRAKPSAIAGKTFAFTGVLPTWSRDQACSRIEAAGGVIVSAVSTKLDYLVAGSEAGSKLLKALELGVPVIGETQLRKMLAGFHNCWVENTLPPAAVGAATQKPSALDEMAAQAASWRVGVDLARDGADAMAYMLRSARKPTPAPTGIDATLAERGSRYGKFEDHAAITMQLKDALRRRIYENTTKFQADQLEAIDMICHKLGRIVNGDPNYADSWVDIAGYAKLVADRLEGVSR